MAFYISSVLPFWSMIVLLQISCSCPCKSVGSTIPVLALHSVEPDCCRRVCWCIIHPTAWSSHSSMCAVTQVAIEPQSIEVTPVDALVVICTSISFTRRHPDHTVLITLLGDKLQHLIQARPKAHWSVHLGCTGGVGDAKPCMYESPTLPLSVKLPLDACSVFASHIYSMASSERHRCEARTTRQDPRSEHVCL